MWRQFAEPSVLIELDVLRVIYRVELEWVDGDQYGADIGIDVSLLEPGLQVLEQSLFGEIGQLAQVGVLPVPGLVEEAEEVVPDELAVGAVSPAERPVHALHNFAPQTELVVGAGRHVAVGPLGPEQLQLDGTLGRLDAPLLAVLATVAVRHHFGQFVARAVLEAELVGDAVHDLFGGGRLGRLNGQCLVQA